MFTGARGVRLGPLGVADFKLPTLTVRGKVVFFSHGSRQVGTLSLLQGECGRGCHIAL